MNLDRIEREVFIHAPLPLVYTFAIQPAWWVGDKPGPDRVIMDGLRVVAETAYGPFTVLIEKMESPYYYACRWASSFPGEEPKEGNSTLVEFTLQEKEEGTLVRVVESGFSTLTITEEEREMFYEGNARGWDKQLEALRKRIEG